MPGIDGFTTERIATNGVTLSVHRGGDGPPLYLLHGFPQTHMAWARVAPAFARTHRVIVPDLRGYGGSEAPPDDPAHETYSKREMARDIAGLMDALGHDRAAVIGHDRGARVAYRMALDMPARVARLGIVEVVPTGDFWAAWNARLGLAAYHWTFLAQPAPLPERLIAGDPEGFLDLTLASWTRAKSLSVFGAAALESYRAQFRDPARVAAMCADYRAGATTDWRDDEADRAVGRRIAAPVRFLWAESGFPARTGDPVGLWRRWADEVSGAALTGCGHFAPEEAPEAVIEGFRRFLAEAG
jgi:haloacetate dehalogenase